MPKSNSPSKDKRDLREGMDFIDFIACPQCKKRNTFKRNADKAISKCSNCGTGITDEYLSTKYIKGSVDKNCKDPDDDSDNVDSMLGI